MMYLMQLLAEITATAVEPYATQFVWKRVNQDEFETRVVCDGHMVLFNMHGYGTPGEYTFAIATPAAHGYTVSHRRNVIAGQLSYLRVLRTAFESILDFCAQHAPDVVDVTGFDTQSTKAAQKTRIYQQLLQSGDKELLAAGYRLRTPRGKLLIVRKSQHDATGIE
jgi:hypothetical protein